MKRLILLTIACGLWSVVCMAQVTHEFRNTPLTEALRTIELSQGEYTISVLSDGFADLRTSAKVKNLSAPDAVKLVCKGLPVKVKVKGQKIYVQRKKEKVKQYETSVWGYLVDDIMYQPVVGARVTVMTAKDSTVINSLVTRIGNRSNTPCAFVRFDITGPGEYIIKAEADGYETTYNNWSIDKLYKYESSISLKKPFYINRAKKRKEYQLSEVVVKAQKITKYNVRKHTSFTMVSVEGGTYTMGDSACSNYADYAREVTVDNFAIGQYEVTQELWETVMYGKPIYAKKKHSYLYAMRYTPMDCVSWDDCQKFIKKLNKLTGKKFRLPTEAEWEFAARGAKLSKGYIYSGSDILDSVAWHRGNSGRMPHRVGTKQPNELGIYDMTGNVNEWCQDGMDYGGKNRSLNSGAFKVYRGGYYDYDNNNYIVRLKTHHGQANFHEQGLPGLGFRLALSE